MYRPDTKLQVRIDPPPQHQLARYLAAALGNRPAAGHDVTQDASTQQAVDADMGGYAPDSAQTHLSFSHSDDWFLFPVMAQAGKVVAVESIEVRDAFGRTYGSQDKDEGGNPLWKGLHPPQGWTPFKVDGTRPEVARLALQNLILWQVAEFPLESAPLERVQFGLDEESNLLWAVERTVTGCEVELCKIDVPDSLRFNDGKPSGDARKAREYAYVPAQGVVPHWLHTPSTKTLRVVSAVLCSATSWTSRVRSP